MMKRLREGPSLFRRGEGKNGGKGDLEIESGLYDKPMLGTRKLLARIRHSKIIYTFN